MDELGSSFSVVTVYELEERASIAGECRDLSGLHSVQTAGSGWQGLFIPG
jgi:hypothetical protein